MNSRGLLVGAATGSALMFMLDPATGRRRRALMRDQMTRATRKARDGADAAARDLVSRAGGVAAATRGRVTETAVSDETVIARVRAKLGRVSTHPRAIDVDAHDGEVILRGPVLSSERGRVAGAVAGVRGVRGVRDELEPHDTAEGLPALQGEGRVARLLNLRPQTWRPAGKAVFGAGLLAIVAWLAMRGRPAPHDWEQPYGSL